jgi:hypothetical protein
MRARDKQQAAAAGEQAVACGITLDADHMSDRLCESQHGTQHPQPRAIIKGDKNAEYDVLRHLGGALR